MLSSNDQSLKVRWMGRVQGGMEGLRKNPFDPSELGISTSRKEKKGGMSASIRGTGGST
jgi:hypothetical protein